MSPGTYHAPVMSHQDALKDDRTGAKGGISRSGAISLDLAHLQEVGWGRQDAERKARRFVYTTVRVPLECLDTGTMLVRIKDMPDETIIQKLMDNAPLAVCRGDNSFDWCHRRPPLGNSPLCIQSLENRTWCRGLVLVGVGLFYVTQDRAFPYGVARTEMPKPNEARDHSSISVRWGATNTYPYLRLPAMVRRKLRFGVVRGNWYILNDTDQTQLSSGNASDIPVPADYNGDGKWMRLETIRRKLIYPDRKLLKAVVQWGKADDITVPVDYNKDGKAE